MAEPKKTADATAPATETAAAVEAAPVTAATKTAADILIEMQLEEQRKKATNPLVVVSEETIDAELEEGKGVVVARKVFADGAVLETYA